MYEEGAIINLVGELQKYNIEIAAIQEKHLAGTSIQKVNNYTLFTSGNESRRLGVGFLIKDTIEEDVKYFGAQSERICSIRIKTRHKTISIINAHAPTEEKDEETKDEFYEILEEMVQKIPKTDLKLVIGDMNAKVGREEIYREVTGGESKHEESNDNGLRLITFAIEQKMKIMSTHFKRKDIHKGTWRIPGRKETNQIDHVLGEEEEARRIKNVRTYRGADADSDHFLVIMEIKLSKMERKRRKNKKEIKYNVKELQNTETAGKYIESIEGEYKDKDGQGEEVELKWKKFEESIIKATRANLPRYRRIRRSHWMDEACKEEINKKTRMWQKFLHTQMEQDKNLFKEQKNKVKQMCRARKRKYMEEEIRDIEEKYRNKEIRNFYKGVKGIRTENKGTQRYVKDKEGELLGNPQEVKERWKEYFELELNISERLRGEESVEEEGELGGETQEEEIRGPEKEEIREIIHKMKNNKSPGENGITAENLKYGGEIVIDKVHELIKIIWNTEKMPQQWAKALIVPVPKKGDRTECSNYRGIAISDITYKVLAIVIKRRLEGYIEAELGEYQAGFRKNRSTSDQIFTMKQILIGAYEYEIPTQMLFVDFKAAYDSIIKEKMYEALRVMGIPRKIIRLVKMTLNDTRCAVKINGEISESFEVKRGVRQGDPLSTLLFNAALELTIRKSGINRSGTLLNKSHQCLAYADDILLIARSRKKLEEVAGDLFKTAKQIGLQINKSKTKYMELKNKQGENRQNNLRVQMGEEGVQEFEEVEEYMYLGVLITNKCKEEREIDLRIAKGSRCAGSVNRIIRSKNVSRNTKLRIYKTILRPTVLYSSETWTMTKKTQYSLEVWERKVLRRIYGGKKVDGVWERRTNAEIYELYNEPNITQVIKARRLQWLGHMERLPDERIVKEVRWRIPEGRRKRGRPRKKWWEAVKEDLKEKGGHNWKQIAKDRERWKLFIRQWA